MQYQLKKGIEAFTVVEGPGAGLQFKPGESYAEIPPAEAKKFEPLLPPPEISGRLNKKAVIEEDQPPEEPIPSATTKK